MPQLPWNQFVSATADAAAHRARIFAESRAGSRALRIAACGLLFSVYLLWLNRTGLVGPDEPRYASIGREMARTGDFITPRLWNEPWFEKPALLYWLIALGNRAGLDADLAPRLPVSILSLAFLIFFFLKVRALWSAREAAFSTAILATSAGWLAYSHIAVTDLPMGAAFAASMLFALEWTTSRSRSTLILSGASLGAAVLAKGFVPLVLAGPFLWRSRRELRGLLPFFASCAAVAAPWYVLCLASNGYPFFEQFFLRHHLQRFTTGDQLHAQPIWYYVPVLLGLLMPWPPLLGLLRRSAIQSDRRLSFVFAWLAWGLLFFSISAGKLPGYLIPLLPAAALLMGVHAAAVRERNWFIPACALMIAVIPVAGAVLPQAVSAGLSRSTISQAPWWLIALSAAAAWWLRNRQAAVTIAVIAAAACFGGIWVKWAAYPRLDAFASARPVWSEARSLGLPVCLGDLHRSYVYGLKYYAARPLPYCDEVSEAVQVLPSLVRPAVVRR